MYTISVNRPVRHITIRVRHQDPLDALLSDIFNPPQQVVAVPAGREARIEAAIIIAVTVALSVCSTIAAAIAGRVR